MLLPLILFLAFAGTLTLAGSAVGLGGGSKARLTKRARALAAGTRDPRAKVERLLRDPNQGRLDGLVRRILPKPGALQARLEATGRPITFTQYGVASIAVALVCGALALAFNAPPLLALLEAAASGLWLPHAAVGFLMARRRARFFKLFPEGIGLIVRGLRAGLPVSETVTVVGREIADPIGEEFRDIAEHVRLGQPLEDAMWAVARRLGLAEFNFLVISLSVQRETGGNLAETLENLEQIIRRRQQMRLKIKAMASESTAAALIIGSLPFVMAALMSVVSGAYMRLLFTAPMGRMMLGAALTSLTLGALVMRKMTKFEI